MGDERKPLWAKCWECSHIWPACYLPMEVKKAAAIMSRGSCPMCGERKRVGFAKQEDGKLLEPLTATAEART